MDGHDWDAKGRPDLDLNPPEVLQSRLAESVEGWHSPFDEHRGFHGWVLAPKCRNAYCPLCFYQDLAKGRTPYFRMDWMAVFVSICWEHCTPLMEWDDVDCHGRCRLPKGWLFRSRREKVVWPPRFSEHCRRLMRIDIPERGEEGLVPGEVFAYLHGLQVAIEKQSAERMDAYPMAQSPRDAVRALAKELILSLVSEGIPSEVEGTRSSWLSPSAGSESVPFYGIYSPALRKRWRPTLVNTIRQTGMLKMRRTHLYFAAKVLANSEEFSQAITLSRPAKRPWEAWRWDDVWRAVLANRECDFRFWCPGLT